MSLSDLIHSVSARHPDQPAIMGGDAFISYAQLAERVDAAATLLRTHQVQPGDTVALGLLQSAYWQWVFLLGALRLGAVPAMLGAQPHVQLRAIPGIAPHLVATAGSALAHLPGVRAIEVSTPDLQKIDSTRIVMGLPDSATADGTAGLILFGGLDTPRALRLSTAALQARCLDVAGMYSLDGDSRLLNMQGIEGAHGIESAFATWTAGGTLVLAARPGEPGALLASAGVNRLLTTPRGLAALVEAKGLPELTTLACHVTVLGAPLSAALVEDTRRLFGAAPRLVLGGPEAGVYCSGVSEDFAAHTGCVGRARPGVELQVISRDAQPVGPGQTGLIRVQTPTLATTYLDGVESTNGFGLRQGWYDTGLLGHVATDGRLCVSGTAVQPRKRASAVASDNAGGQQSPRVWSRGSLEQAVAALPGVVEVCVLSQSQPDRSIVPVIIYTGDTDETPESMGGQVRSLIGADQRFHLIRVPSLPRHPDGGVARNLLAASLQAYIKQAREQGDAGQTRH